MSSPVTLPLIDHLALRVRDVRRSRTFYEQAVIVRIEPVTHGALIDV